MPASRIERGTNIEWYDPITGSWVDLGEARHEDDARERIAGLHAADHTTNGEPRRYRIVTTIIEEEGTENG